MASFVLSTVARTALANATALNELLANGTLELRTGASPGPDANATGTLLVTFTLPPGANNAPANGVLVLGAVANANGVANGVAQYGRFKLANAVTIADADIGMGANTITLDNSNIAVNQVCSISSANFTVPAGT